MSVLDTSLGQQESFCDGTADVTPAFSLPASALLFPGTSQRPGFFHIRS